MTGHIFFIDVKVYKMLFHALLYHVSLLYKSFLRLSFLIYNPLGAMFTYLTFCKSKKEVNVLCYYTLDYHQTTFYNRDVMSS